MQPPNGLCVALDGSDREWITSTARSLGGIAGWCKLGLEAFTAHGPELVRELAAGSAGVFLDLKLHDIPATVRRAAANCAASGAHMITVHAGGGPSMLRAAVEGAAEAGGDSPPRVVAVTVLTSLDDTAVADLGLQGTAEEMVVRWATLAVEAGCDGVVCSAREVHRLRAAFGPDLLLVTPGIRPTWSIADDQRRVVTPRRALLEGADILVIGRPITRAESPALAARKVLDEMSGTLPG